MNHSKHCTTLQDGIEAHCDCKPQVLAIEVVTTLCSLCREPLLESDFGTCMQDSQVADHMVYDIEGDLDCIELAHKRCAVTDNARRFDNYWSYN